MTTPSDVVSFWLNEVGEQGWYKSDPAMDDEIRSRFGAVVEAGAAGELTHWTTDPEGVLAYLIVTDQFPRNIYRGSSLSFSSDTLALKAAKCALSKEWDLRISGPERQFFYLPLMHSENLCDQDRCVRLMLTRMPGAESNILHARAHREVIRTFGRFPYRNEALDRVSRPAELDYMQSGGYGRTLETLRVAA
ncbi:DUF924 family protein [Palleronia caenipelagi]|uniref:DUF924 domain-containing protein n=1 Tax=Palleronia caenipelagi TaxID=2489174 RepID=A0A547Q9L6_9RHOB|nr:DUF924 family protein [Palleronia caenipelagi]TRD23083.1 DUF924 domain-containing protein [Palleronia caenipelagi]